jgi:hypothetical protein
VHKRIISAVKRVEFVSYRMSYIIPGARGSVVVKALCYKPEGRGFDSR